MVIVAQLSEYSKTTEFYTLSSKWYVNKSLIKKSLSLGKSVYRLYINIRFLGCDNCIYA